MTNGYKGYGFHLIAAMACIMLLPVCSIAQKGEIPAKLKQVAALMKHTKTYGYHYLIKAEFPNGQTDMLAGEAYMDGENRVMFNRTDAFVMLYSDKWFYRANHREKSITIVNLEKHYNDANKLTGRNELFNNETTAEYLDSMIMKYGRVTSFKEQGDTVFAVLEFRIGLGLTKLELVYNVKDQLPILMNLYVFYPSEQDAMKGIKQKGIAQVIKCNKYKKTIAMKLADTRTYFSVDNGSIRLKQFSNYKIHSLL